MGIIDLGDGQKAIVNLPGWASDKVYGDKGTSPKGLAKAYIAGVWAYICISIRADAIAKLQWDIRTDPEDPETALRVENPAVSTLMDVNPEMNWPDLIRATESDLSIFGTAYWHKVKPQGGGMPRGLMRLNPSTIELKAGFTGIDGFLQRASGREVFFQREEVVYFREYHPLNDLGGLSKMEVAINDVNAGVNAADFVAAFFKNYALPPIIFSSEQSMDEAVVDRNIKWWRRLFQGSDKQHRAGFISGMKPNLIGYPVKDLALKEVNDEIRRNTCGIFRVPPAIAGAWEAANYATSVEQAKALYENAIQPRAEYMSGVIEAEYLPEFERQRRYFIWAFDKLPVMQEDENLKAERHATLVQAGIESPEAAAEALDVTPPEEQEEPVQFERQREDQSDMQRELAQWQRFAERRLKRKEEVAQPFIVESIPKGVHSAIMGQLETVKSVKDIREIFRDATIWGDYPGTNTPRVAKREKDEMDEETKRELKEMRRDMRSLVDAIREQRSSDTSDFLKAILAMQANRSEAPPLGLTIKSDEVSVTPEIKATIDSKPAQVTVNVPESPPPVVNVEAPKPTKQVAPVVNVNVPKQDPPIVNVDFPSRIRERKKVNRNSRGFIESIDGETTLEE